MCTAPKTRLDQSATLPSVSPCSRRTVTPIPRNIPSSPHRQLGGDEKGEDESDALGGQVRVIDGRQDADRQDDGHGPDPPLRPMLLSKYGPEPPRCAMTA